jgi:hypothetical protein
MRSQAVLAVRPEVYFGNPSLMIMGRKASHISEFDIPLVATLRARTSSSVSAACRLVITAAKRDKRAYVTRDKGIEKERVNFC